MKTYSIKLEPWCENCEGFEVCSNVTENFRMYGFDECVSVTYIDSEGVETHFIEREITCKNLKKCQAMYRHLKNVREENTHEDNEA